jgi:cytochrome c-type biogenesis protein CcmE
MRSRIRFIVALSLAALLGGFLLYVSLGGAMETYVSPSQVAAQADDDERVFRLNGVVAGRVPDDAVARARGQEGYRFAVADKDDPATTVTVLYRGTVPDQFKEGREVVVTGEMEDGVFVGRRDTLLALCPSKFTAESNPPDDY